MIGEDLSKNCSMASFYTKNRKKRWKSACKPGSVENSHSSGQRVATQLKQPTRELMRAASMFPYLVLLQVGFTKPPMSPPER